MTHTLKQASALIAAAACLTVGCSDSQRISGASTTAPSAPTTTAVDGADTTSTTLPTISAPTTIAPAVTPATSPPVPPPAPPLTGAALAASTNPIATPAGGITLSGEPCAGDPGIPGWHVADCQYQPSYSDGVQVLVLRRNDDLRFAVAVLFRSAGNWVQRYWAEEAGPGVWSNVTVVVGDFHFDDGAEVWIGYRYDGSGGYLDIDVLDALPDGSFFLGGLQGLDHGLVDLHPGGASVMTAVYAEGEPNCCAGHFLLREVTFVGAQWQVDAGTTYAADAVPALVGDF